jgi:alkylated DNA repair protein alkB family protein 8
MVPWNLQKNYNNGKDKVYNRYYHLFDEGELERLVNNFTNIYIKEKGYQKDNWYIILEKK